MANKKEKRSWLIAGVIWLFTWIMTLSVLGALFGDTLIIEQSYLASLSGVSLLSGLGFYVGALLASMYRNHGLRNKSYLIAFIVFSIVVSLVMMIGRLLAFDQFITSMSSIPIGLAGAYYYYNKKW